MCESNPVELWEWPTRSPILPLRYALDIPAWMKKRVDPLPPRLATSIYIVPPSPLYVDLDMTEPMMRRSSYFILFSIDDVWCGCLL